MEWPGGQSFFSVQLHLMLLGYRVARDFDQGQFPIKVSVYGRLRPLVGKAVVEPQAGEDAKVSTILTKFFNYHPKTRSEALERTWQSSEKSDSLWLDVHPVYVLRKGWRILLNGRDVEYDGGFDKILEPGNKIAIFPPGR
jgi:molybdopterin converting factor small subunit